jgi:hypothetical protein
MELTILIKEKDYVHYVMMHIRKWRSIYFYLILFGLCTIIGCASIIKSADKPLGFDRIMGIVLFSLTAFYILVILLTYFKLKSEYKSNLFLKEPCTYQLNDQGFSATTSISNASISWDSVVKIKQSKKIVAVYISNSQAYIFPKDQLNNTQKSGLSAILATHVPKNKFKDHQLV